MKFKKLNPIVKISLTALFSALSIILLKLLAIQNLSGLPFLRISLGPTMIMASSLILGPVYGGIVGVITDVLGFFIFDSTGFGYNPLLTISYLGYGVLPGLLALLLDKNKKIKVPFIQMILMSLLFIYTIYFFTSRDSFTSYSGVVYNLSSAVKTGIIIVSIVIVILYFFFYYLIYSTCKSDEEKVKLNNISLIVLITLTIFQLLINTFIKSLMFEVDFIVLLGIQSIASFVEIILGTYLICLILRVTKKLIK